MSLLNLIDLQLAFGHVALLDHADLAIEPAERIGLIGRNGTGKSSLLRIMAGLDAPDDGNVQRQQGIRTAHVAQEPVLAPEATVFDAVSAGVCDAIQLRQRYQAGGSSADLDRLQSQIEAVHGWNWEQRVDETLARLHLAPQAVVGHLSGGMRKRVALAQAIVASPDLLLLDEPTNHLDLDSIDWLAGLLLDFNGSVVVITHDRHFLDRVATRIVELDRGHLASFPGSFSTYRLHKDQQLAQEATVNAKADKLLAQEETWIRKGVEARRTRSQSRIERLQLLRSARADRRNALGRVKMDIVAGHRSGRIVAELTNVGKGFAVQTALQAEDVPQQPSPTTPIVKGLSATFLRGDRIGLIGPNGAGKTTLLRLILGTLQPDEGGVRRGTNLQVAYFDQMRDAIDPDQTLEDFISPGGEWIENGAQRLHVRSYLADFLFSPARARSPIRSLSGGERNRLLLARLFAQPANLLVLDEPTNDLDIETLELLEERLQNYDGTVFLVSHDRSFLDNVVTSTLVFEGDGLWREYEGGVTDWLVQSARARAAPAGVPQTQGAAAVPAGRAPAPASSATTPKPAGPAARRKLSYKDQRELDELPSLIERLETEQQAIAAELADATIYARDARKATLLYERQAAIEEELTGTLERWEQLESGSRA